LTDRSTSAALRLAASPGASRRELLLTLAGALAATLVALAWSVQRGALLMFGDAEAHLHIARRLFDSHRPGIAQLGSVWLPLPHLMLAPFVACDALWRSGLAGAIPSAAEYAVGCVGIYWLARRWLSVPASLVALVLFGANANLLYLSTTAMTEPLFVAELIWSVVLVVKWRNAVEANRIQRANGLLWLLIAVLVAAVATRYDGWILGFLIWVAMACMLVPRKQLFRAHFIAASVVLLAAPVAWMFYNGLVFGDPLDFMRGPYSAQAIELRTAAGVFPPHPGWHNPWVALLFFVKAAEMVVGIGWWGQAIFVASVFGALWAWRTINFSAVRWTLLLWLPLPFYCYSVAYGSVPIFLPGWWPHSWYNTRYGLELLPAIALFAGFAAEAMLRAARRRWPSIVQFLGALFVTAALINALWTMRSDPVVLAEARCNHQARWAFEYQIAARLSAIHRRAPEAIFLMDTSAYPQVIPDAGLTYHQTLNESDKQYYTAALATPQTFVSAAVAFAGDRVEHSMAAHRNQFHPVWTFHAPGQPTATIYVCDTLAQKLGPAM